MLAACLLLAGSAVRGETPVRLFVSTQDHEDFRLEPDSPAFALGFKPIPVDKIGPYKDELRASWPIVEAPGAREHPVKPPR